MLFQCVVLRLATLWSNETLEYQFWYEVGTVVIVFSAEFNDISHRFLVPLREASTDHGSLAEIRHEVIIGSMIFILSLEVLSYGNIFHLTQLAYSGRPNEKGENMLATEPALIIFFCYNLPLACPRNHSFVANVSCNDACLLVYYIRVDELIHTL